MAKKILVKFDTSPVDSRLASKKVYSLQMKERPIYEDNKVFDEVVKEKTLPIDADLLKFAVESVVKTTVKKVASDCISRKICDCLKVVATMRGTVDGPYSPYDPETCSTAIVVQSLKGVEKSVDMSKVQFVNSRPGVKAKVKKVTWRGADATKQIKEGFQIRCTGDNLTWLEGDYIDLSWTAADGTPATATITSIIEEDSDVDTIMLEWPSALDGVPVGTEVTFAFSLRGGIEEAQPNPSKVKVEVVSADEPVPPTPGGDEPEIERGYSEGHGEGDDDGKVFPGTGFVLEGTNFAGASVKITYQIAGSPSDVDVDPEDMTVTDTSIDIDAASPALQEAVQATGTLTFTVTTSAGSDTYNAVVME